MIDFYQQKIKNKVIIKYPIIFISIFLALLIFFPKKSLALEAPTNLIAETASATQINLTWLYANPSAITGYLVYRNDGQNFVVENDGVNKGNYYLKFSDTTANGTQTYYVTAYDIALGESDPSNTAQAITSNPPNSPTNLVVNDGLTPITDSSPKFSWTYSDPEANDLSAYRIIVYAVQQDNDDFDLFAKEMWDSGKISKVAINNSTVEAYYNDADGTGDNNDSFGHPLDWNGPNGGAGTYTVRIQVWDSNGLASDLSARTPAVTFEPGLSGGSIAYERFEDTGELDTVNTTADWNDVYGEARLKSFATVNSYLNLRTQDTTIKPAVYWNTTNNKYYVIYLKKSSGNYGLYYQRFTLTGQAEGAELAIDDDLGTQTETNLLANISCDTVNSRCGIIYTEQSADLDSLFVEINPETSVITINAVQIQKTGDSFLNEKAPVIAFGASGGINKYLVGWYEENYPDRKGYFTLINRSGPTVDTPTQIATSTSNIFPAVAFNQTDKQFGLVWSSRYDITGFNDNSEIFFNIIDFNGSPLINNSEFSNYFNSNCLTCFVDGYSNYPAIKWVGGGTYGSEYYVIWKDTKDYNYVVGSPWENSSVGDAYFTKVADDGGVIMDDVKLTGFFSRRKYFTSETAAAINCDGNFALNWLDDRAVGNNDNSDPNNKTFNNFFTKFSTNVSPPSVITKEIYDILLSTKTLPLAPVSTVDDSINTYRSIVLAPACPDNYFTSIFDQAGDIYLQNIPNQSGGSALFDLTNNVIQSEDLVTNPGGLGSVVLYNSDQTPANTSITYYLATNDQGTTWQQVTPGVATVLTNTVLRWKAILNSTDSNESPKVGSLAFVLSLIPPDPPADLLVDNWGPPLNNTPTTTENFSPLFTWTYTDPTTSNLTAYRLQVCATAFDATTQTCPKDQLMWDSSKTTKNAASGDQINVYYNDLEGDGTSSKNSSGHPLDWRSNDNYDYYHWRVKVWNSGDIASAWSADYTSETSARFRYGDEVLVNLIFSDDLKTTTYQGAISFDNSPEYYPGAQGEVRLVYNWPSGGSPNGTLIDSAVGKYSDIALDSKNNPHICYFDDANKKLKYAYYNGSSWTTEDVTSANQGGYSCSLTINKDDVPHISYYSNYIPTGKADLMSAKKSGASWTLTVVEVSVIDADCTFSNTSIAVDSSGYPIISYYSKPTNWASRSLKYAWYNGAVWQTGFIEAATDASDNGLAIDKDNHLHVAYRKDNFLKYAYSASPGSLWSIEEVMTNLPFPQYLSIEVDSSNNPAISYLDATSNPTYYLKYSKKESGTWAHENITSFTYAQQYTSLKLDSLTNPFITFSGGANNDADLFLTKKESGSWNQTTVDSLNSIGQYSSLVLDNNDLPYLSYWFRSANNLRYLRPVYNTSQAGYISSLDTYPGLSTIYGSRFHASYSKPGGSGTLTFEVSADNGVHWINPETGQAGCLDTSQGCLVNFAASEGQGMQLLWKVTLTSANANYTPRVGSVAIETYNIPPVITSCTYYPPAIDPTQLVEITAVVSDENSGTLETRWCYDLTGSLGECSNPPDLDWTSYQSGVNTSQTYNIADIYNPAVQAKDVEGQESNIFICPNLFVGNVQIAWLETRYGNIYSRGDIMGYGVPCELCGQRNATYKLQSSGQIIGFNNECKNILCTGLSGSQLTQCQDECFSQYSPIINFPSYPDYRNIYADLTAEPMLRALLNNPASAPYGFQESNFIDLATDPGYDDLADLSFAWGDDDSGYFGRFQDYEYANIYYIKDSSDNVVELNSDQQENPGQGWCGDLKGFRNVSSVGMAGDGLIIVDGDLHIYSGKYYGDDGFGNCLNQIMATATPQIIYNNSTAITKISQLASVAFIIRGDLIIEPDIQELSGTFIVLGQQDVDCVKANKEYTPHCGAIYTAGKTGPNVFGDSWIPINNRKQLTINGLVIAKAFSLGRNYFDWLANQPGEIFINDGRALLNPPPGIADIISALPNWQLKLVP